MPLPRFCALPSKIAPGMFSSERIFRLTLADGSLYRGLAPRHFCWNADGKTLTETEPANETDGFIAGRVVEEIDDTQVAVEVPTGEVIAVDRPLVRSRPTEIRPPNVPLAAETMPNVSV